jgi:hypothetical protein
MAFTGLANTGMAAKRDVDISILRSVQYGFTWLTGKLLVSAAYFNFKGHKLSHLVD